MYYDTSAGSCVQGLKGGAVPRHTCQVPRARRPCEIGMSRLAPIRLLFTCAGMSSYLHPHKGWMAFQNLSIDAAQQLQTPNTSRLVTRGSRMEAAIVG